MPSGYDDREMVMQFSVTTSYEYNGTIGELAGLLGVTSAKVAAMIDDEETSWPELSEIDNLDNLLNQCSEEDLTTDIENMEAYDD